MNNETAAKSMVVALVAAVLIIAAGAVIRQAKVKEKLHTPHETSIQVKEHVSVMVHGKPRRFVLASDGATYCCARDQDWLAMRDAGRYKVLVATEHALSDGSEADHVILSVSK